MKQSSLFVILAVCYLFSGCTRSKNEVWDDTRSAGRYLALGLKSLSGGVPDSRQVRDRDEFYREYGFDLSDEFIALQDDAGNPMVNQENVPQARQLPGDPGSGLPTIEGFRDPSADPRLGSIFRNIHFAYNDSQIKGDENFRIIRNMAEHIKNHKNVYVFVEGHCDERGDEAFNFALATRRANAVRNLLVKEGVNPDHLYTVSYGKDRPLVVGHDESSWAINRRAQFKIHDQHDETTWSINRQ